MPSTRTLGSSSVADPFSFKVQEPKLIVHPSGAQRNEVHKWLMKTDPSPVHNTARGHYEAGTGNWVLRSAEWVDWIEGRRRCLWIHGIPGAGKTVLVSHLVENIRQHCEIERPENIVFAYYYCHFSHNQDEASPFLRWILNQLSRRVNTVTDCLWKLYNEGCEPTIKDLLQALAVALDSFDQVFLVVDAIDESMPRDNLLKVFRDLLTDPRFEKIRLLTSSRQYIDIEQVMDDISTPLSMTNPLLDEDIRLYIQTRVDKNSRMQRWPDQLRDEAKEALSTRAKGM